MKPRKSLAREKWKAVLSIKGENGSPDIYYVCKETKNPNEFIYVCGGDLTRTHAHEIAALPGLYAACLDAMKLLIDEFTSENEGNSLPGDEDFPSQERAEELIERLRVALDAVNCADEPNGR